MTASHASTRIMHRVPFLPTHLSVTALTGSGTGSFATNRSPTGKSMLLVFHIYSCGLLKSRYSGAPRNVASIVSRLVDAEYWQRQCSLFFPKEDGYTYGSATGKTVNNVNSWTKGWSISNTTRLIWTNGYETLYSFPLSLCGAKLLTINNRQYDPWRESGVSSDFRPNGPLTSTAGAPLQVIPDGIHCSDLILKNGAANAGVQIVINNEVAQIKAWVNEYYE
jgi:hypothetical protein